MIDVDKIQIGDTVVSDGTIYPKGTKHKVVEEGALGEYWINENSVEISELTCEIFTLVATNTKYSDISEGDIVEVACLSEKQIEHWPDIEKLIGKQGKVVHKSKSVHVRFGLDDQLQSEWCLEPENLRVVKKCESMEAALNEAFNTLEEMPTEEFFDKIGLSALDKQVSGSHYKSCAIQPIEYIHANGLDYFQGNVVKYVTRHKDKNGKADIEKAIHYLELILELQYKDE